MRRIWRRILAFFNFRDGIKRIRYRSKLRRLRGNRTKVNYRKIWSDAYGTIPDDAWGNTFHIHHIDGNCHNNHISNLEALSARDHYRRHVEQGDHLAAGLLEAMIWGGKTSKGIEVGGSSPGKSIVQFTLDGLRVATFDSLKESYGGREGGPIRGCLNGHQKSAYGYQWKYEKDVVGINRINPRKIISDHGGKGTSKNKCLDTNTGKEYGSVGSMARDIYKESFYPGIQNRKEFKERLKLI